ncbi:NAD(P)/FAD-dependent oxidoreductase [Halomonas cupida]|uniref:NAD(P)/FAD-dependent oxidoreductase n=1 Tax=Halomonas cupida TaxID=44933 RepID=UPI003A94CCD6
MTHPKHISHRHTPHQRSPHQRSPHPHLVIVGYGMAAHRLIETLRRMPGAPQRITVIGEEPQAAYNRIMLSPWLAGEIDTAGLTLAHAEHSDGPLLIRRCGQTVVAIHRQQQWLECDNGEIIHYDHLVLATGSRPAMPEVPGIDLKGVYGFRDLADAEALATDADQGGQAVVVGGGLLGLEAAEALRKRGMQVTVLQRSPRLMNRQLDDTAAGMLAEELMGRGIRLHTGAQIAEIIGDEHGKACGVLLQGQQTPLPAQVVVITTGITANVEPGHSAGLACDRALLVNDQLLTSDPHISALGECCQFEQHTYGLVEPIWHQVEVLALRLCGTPGNPYHEASCATRLKISGISLFAFGPTEARPEHEVLTYRDSEQAEYRRLLLTNDRLVGAVLYGDTRMGPWLFELAQQRLSLVSVRHSLLLGQADTEALMAEQSATDNSPDHQKLSREAA